MTIQDFAILPENRSGFWIQKQYSEDGYCTYLVFHQRMTEFCNSISEAKQKLRDRYSKSHCQSKNVLKLMRQSKTVSISYLCDH